MDLSSEVIQRELKTEPIFLKLKHILQEKLKHILKENNEDACEKNFTIDNIKPHHHLWLVSKLCSDRTRFITRKKKEN